MLLPQVFHPSMDSEGHVDLSTICEDWKPENTIKTVIFGLNRLFLLPHTGANVPAAGLLGTVPCICNEQRAWDRSVRVVLGSLKPPRQGL